MRRVQRRGFTLMELLVVIGIVGVLMTLGAAAVFKAALASEERVERANWHLQRKMGTTGRRAKPIRVLFVGNSYTFANNLPRQVQLLAEAAGDQPALGIDSQLVGGATLEQHWNEGVALKKIRQEKWDFVVLQEQSMRPVIDRASMWHYARLFDPEIREQESIPLYFLTWARQSLPETQVRLNSSYVGIARERKSEVAPVGVAWREAFRQLPGLVLHDPDGSHPNPTGTYLAACVFYATIYEKSPEGLPSRLADGSTVLADVPPGVARQLQAVAWKVSSDMRKDLLRRRGLSLP
jgi:prepilin-type N-terminal cleavage/methylation domain-containing protein